MKKAVFLSTLLAVILTFVQTTWFKDGIVWGISPDFALGILLWVAYLNKGNEALFAAFLTGLARDLLSASPLGYSAFLLLLPLYAMQGFRKVITSDRLFIPVILGFAATLAKAVASIFLLGIFRREDIGAYSLGDLRLWVEASINGALSPLFFFLVEKGSKFLVTRGVTES
ncbi:MAG: rod shape-determining protein MreD [Spirochaetota bacterium]